MIQDVPLVALSGVTRAFGSGETRTEVLKEIDLTLGAGRSLAIVGPSGSGKSTLLNIIGALDRPDAGEVHVAGEDLLDLDDAALAGLRNRKIGFVFQLHHLLPQCSVLENVLIPALLLPEHREESRERARVLLGEVGLGKRLHHRPAALSGGERQRVAFVRALVNEPQLVLADEPTGSLDHAGATALADLLVDLNRGAGVGMICVTHSVALAERMETALELRDGVLHPTYDE